MVRKGGQTFAHWKYSAGLEMMLNWNELGNISARAPEKSDTPNQPI
jgi:hypothetical protein